MARPPIKNRPPSMGVSGGNVVSKTPTIKYPADTAKVRTPLGKRGANKGKKNAERGE